MHMRSHLMAMFTREMRHLLVEYSLNSASAGRGPRAELTREDAAAAAAGVGRHPSGRRRARRRWNRTLSAARAGRVSETGVWSLLISMRRSAITVAEAQDPASPTPYLLLRP